MLTFLEIKNFLLVESIQIEFRGGLTVITGETGAGKSIIISALMLLLGHKLAGRKVVRPGSQSTEAVVVARFDVCVSSVLVEFIGSLGIAVDDEIVVRRHLMDDGRSKAFINDIAVSVTTLAKLGEYMVEICGQHSSRSLLERSNHMALIDGYAGNGENLKVLKGLYAAFMDAKRVLEGLLDKKERSAVERDFLSNAVAELKALATHAGEEDELIEKRSSVAGRYKLTELVSRASQKYESLQLEQQLYSLQKELERGGDVFAKVLPPLAAAISELKECEAQLIEVADQYSEDINMEQIESRLFKIRSAARKYNVITADLPTSLLAWERELEEIDNLDFLIKRAESVVVEARSRYLECAKIISLVRQERSVELKGEMERHLCDVKMEKVGVMISVAEWDDAAKWNASGINSVEFLVRTNPGMAFGEISKTASGGELSRIMLAMKLALSKQSEAGLLIFDEVDTGISGAVATAVGRKLASLSSAVQVLVITHQPQVAAFATSHIHVSKVANDERALVHVTQLSAEGHTEAIAMMLAGESVTEHSLAAARALVEECKV